MIPGEIIPAEGGIVFNAGAKKVTLQVANAGDRPVQVGSHYHFFEVNAALQFDRTAARGTGPATGTNATTCTPGPWHLAPMVGASLEIMEADTRRMRGERPYVFTNMKAKTGVDVIAAFIQKRGGM